MVTLPFDIVNNFTIGVDFGTLSARAEDPEIYTRMANFAGMRRGSTSPAVSDVTSVP